MAYQPIVGIIVDGIEAILWLIFFLPLKCIFFFFEQEFFFLFLKSIFMAWRFLLFLREK